MEATPPTSRRHGQIFAAHDLQVLHPRPQPGELVAARELHEGGDHLAAGGIADGVHGRLETRLHHQQETRPQRLRREQREAVVPGIVGVAVEERRATAPQSSVCEELHGAHVEPADGGRARPARQLRAERTLGLAPLHHRVDAQRQGVGSASFAYARSTEEVQPASWTEVRPSRARSCSPAVMRRSSSGPDGRGMRDRTRSCAASTSTPVGWPCASRRMRPPAGLGRPGVDADERQGPRVHPCHVAVHALEQRWAIRHGRAERASGGEGLPGPAVLVPAAPAHPRAGRERAGALGGERHAGGLVRGAAAADLLERARMEDDVAMRVGQARDGAARTEFHHPGPGVSLGATLPSGPELQDAAVPGEQRLARGRAGSRVWTVPRTSRSEVIARPC